MHTKLSVENARSLVRDYADLQALSQCEGTRSMVESRLKQMKFEMKMMGLTEAEINQLNQDFKDIDGLKKL